MMIVMFLIVALLALAVESYIYYSLLRKSCRLFRVLYIVQALVLTIGFMSIVTFFWQMMGDGNSMSIAIWATYVFLVSFAAKLFLALGLAVRQLLRLIWRGRKFNGVLYAGSALSVFLVILLLYGAVWGRTEIRTEFVEIESSKIPQSFDGFRIVQFSDVHLGNFGSWTSLIEDLVETINDIDPDIVVQTGDLVNIHSEELTPEFIGILSQIQAPVYAVLGNHDLAYYIADTVKINPSASIGNLIEKQQQMGWNLMQNKGEWLRRGEDSIRLAGVTFPRNHHHNGYNSVAGGSDMPSAMEGVTPADYSILLAHSPSMFDSLSATTPLPDLTISGHVHTMQLKVSVGDWKWSPAAWLYPMFSGLYEDRGRYLYVNDGLGYVLYPVRLGAKPELTVFTLRHK